MKRIFRIHPAIGIARLGNADPADSYIGPEFPGIPANWDPATKTFLPFKTAGGAVKKQAARFRIWEYVDDGSGKLLPNREVNLDNPEITEIITTEWCRLPM